MPHLRSSLLALLVAGLLAIPAVAVAGDSTDAAEDSAKADTTEEVVADEEVAEEITAEPSAVITIPVLGSDLVVTVTLDDEGTLADVALDPAADFEAMTNANSEADHKMTFSAEDGSVVVKVAAKHGAISTKVKVDSVDALVGPGTWTGDVFGTGDIATVNYTISVDAAGMPLVTIDESVNFALAGAEMEVKQGEVESKDGEAESTAKVEFEYDGDKRKLKITAKMETKDGESRVGLKITISGDKPDDLEREEPSDERPDKKDKTEKPAKKDKKDKTDDEVESNDVRSDESSDDRGHHRKDD